MVSLWAIWLLIARVLDSAMVIKKAQMEFRHQSSQIYQNGYTQGYTQGCLELKRQLLPVIEQQQSTIAKLQSIIAQQKNIIECQKKYSELLEFKYCEQKKQK